MRSLRTVATAALAAALTLLAACSDAVAPSETRAVGAYVAAASSATAPLGASQFVTTAGGVSVDRLAAGGRIQLELRPDGTTRGRLLLPLSADEREPGDPAVLDADLAGTWTIADGVVRFQHAADTFLRDMPFTLRDGRLEGERQIDAVTVRVVLVRE